MRKPCSTSPGAVGGVMLLLTVVTVATAGLGLADRRLASRSWVALLFVAAVVLFLLAATGPPADYPTAGARCAGIAPVWWPGWLPT